MILYVVKQKEVMNYVIVIINIHFEKLFFKYNEKYRERKNREKVWYFSALFEIFYVLLFLTYKYYEDTKLVILKEWAQLIMYHEIPIINISEEELRRFELDVLDLLDYNLHIGQDYLFGFCTTDCVTNKNK